MENGRLQKIAWDVGTRTSDVQIQELYGLSAAMAEQDSMHQQINGIHSSRSSYTVT